MPTYYSKKKKTERLSFTITPSLKNELLEFVEESKKESPENVMFKSLSSFCYYIIKDVLDIMKKGFDLKKIKNNPDKKTVNFYDQITFKAIIPLFESALELNKYNNDIIKFPTFFFGFWKYLKTSIDWNGTHSIRDTFGNIRNFVLTNNLTREFRLDISTEKNFQKGTLEYVGNYSNLHYNNCKAVAAIMGVLGIKITNFDYSEQDHYARFDLIETDFFNAKEIYKKDRMRIIEENLKYIANYEKIINDNDEHLWIKLAKFKDISVKFYSYSSFENFFKILIDDFKNYGDKNSFLRNILRVFQKLHWISIENEIDLSFRITLPSLKSLNNITNKLKNRIDNLMKKYNNDKEIIELASFINKECSSEEMQLMLELISKFGTLTKKGDLYYLS